MLAWICSGWVWERTWRVLFVTSDPGNSPWKRHVLGSLLGAEPHTSLALLWSQWSCSHPRCVQNTLRHWNNNSCRLPTLSTVASRGLCASRYKVTDWGEAPPATAGKSKNAHQALSTSLPSGTSSLVFWVVRVYFSLNPRQQHFSMRGYNRLLPSQSLASPLMPCCGN